MTDIWFQSSIGGRADALRPSALPHKSLSVEGSQVAKNVVLRDSNAKKCCEYKG